MDSNNLISEDHDVAPRIACVQMVSSTDVNVNINTAGELIAQAVADGAQVVILPEYFCIMGRNETDKLAVAGILWGRRRMLEHLYSIFYVNRPSNIRFI